MKTLNSWMLALALPLFAMTPACIVVDDDDSGDDGSDETGNDDGPGDDGPGDDGPGDDGPGDDGPGDDGPGDDGPGDDGPGDDGPGDDGPAGGDVGDECMSDGDCATNVCLFAGDAAFGFCSIVCDSFSDCPSFWECEEVGNASTTYCVPGE